MNLKIDCLYLPDYMASSSINVLDWTKKPYLLDVDTT